MVLAVKQACRAWMVKRLEFIFNYECYELYMDLRVKLDRLELGGCLGILELRCALFRAYPVILICKHPPGCIG